MLKGYKYRLHPTTAQEEFLIKTIGCARFIYNKLLEDRIAIREEAKAGDGTRRKPATPASYKCLFPFLAEADSLALANAKLNLDTAFAKFSSRRSAAYGSSTTSCSRTASPSARRRKQGL